MGYFGNIGVMITQVLFGLLLFVAVLRVMLPLVALRFSNPICQAVYRFTNPLVGPLTRIVPSYRKFSIAALLIAWIIATIEIAVICALVNRSPGFGWLLLFGLGGLANFILGVLFWSVIVRAVMSFFSPDYANPAVEVLFAITDPVLRPFRKLMPRNATIDLSPIIPLLLIRIVQYTLLHFGLTGFPA
jgi:YggT family protein